MANDFDTILMECEEAMEKVADHLSHEFVSISAGRASPAMVENIKFDYYGAMTPLKQAAQIGTPDAQTITLKPFDVSQLKVMAKAIVDANIGLAPSDDGKVIICRVPQMTQENRERLVKQLKEIAEKSKVGVRNARQHAMKDADASLKETLLTEDTHREVKEEIQNLTNTYNKKIEEILEKKTSDVMKV